MLRILGTVISIISGVKGFVTLVVSDDLFKGFMMIVVAAVIGIITALSAAVKDEPNLYKYNTKTKSEGISSSEIKGMMLAGMIANGNRSAKMNARMEEQGKQISEINDHLGIR